MWCERGDRRRDLYLAHGFAHVRSFRRMRMDLGRLPDDIMAYVPPPGVEVRRFVRDRDERSVWAAMEEAFIDHFRFSPEPLDEWRQKQLDRANADTDLWYVAWDDDEVAGVAISYIEWFGGYVDTIAVRRPWRRRGLGTLLLITSFAALRERGCTAAVLGVDADNATGAVGIYERAGMRESGVVDFYEKRLR